MSVTITFYLWWLGAYLAAGAALFLPLGYVANLQIHQRPPFWSDLVRAIRRRPYMVPATVALWPLAAWDILEYPVKKVVRRWRG